MAHATLEICGKHGASFPIHGVICSQMVVRLDGASLFSWGAENVDQHVVHYVVILEITNVSNDV